MPVHDQLGQQDEHDPSTATRSRYRSIALRTRSGSRRYPLMLTAATRVVLTHYRLARRICFCGLDRVG
jgi:hypothetical protein